MILATLPNIVLLRLEESWSIYWWATVILSLYLRTSERIFSNVSVAKFWNSSIYTENGTRFSSGMSARIIATWYIRVIIMAPMRISIWFTELSFTEFHEKDFWLSMMSAKFILFSVWQTIFRIMGELTNWATLLRIGMILHYQIFHPRCEFICPEIFTVWSSSFW